MKLLPADEPIGPATERILPRIGAVITVPSRFVSACCSVSSALLSRCWAESSASVPPPLLPARFGWVPQARGLVVAAGTTVTVRATADGEGLGRADGLGRAG